MASAEGGNVGHSDTSSDVKVHIPTEDSGIVVGSEANSPDTETAGDGVGNPAINTNNSAAHKGPDEVAPAECEFTWKRDEAVKLRMTNKGYGSEKPISVPTVLKNVTSRIPTSLAMCVKRGDNWKKWTYAEYHRDVMQAAKALIKLGLEPYHGVGIIGFNCPEWFIADMAAIHAGGFAVGIYTTNSPEACQYVASNCDANVIAVENDTQLQKILKVRDQLPHLKAIVQWQGNLKEPYPNVYTWETFMNLGNDSSLDNVLDERIRAQSPNKACTLIYTSGTTGNPKGVMLSHDNVTWTADVAGKQARLDFGKEVVVSYLPLSHIAAQLLDMYFPLIYGGTVYFAKPDALKGSLAETLKEVQPTAFLGVPRVWEKMQEKMQAIGKNVTGMKKKIADWAKSVGHAGNISKMNGKRKRRGQAPWSWSIANALVFKKVREGLGLSRCRFCLTGAAPIMRETLDYFLSLDIPIFELYGMSESTGPHTLSFPWRYRIGSVGVDMFGAETKLDSPDKDGNGEICMRGRHVFMGYLGMEEKTREAIRDEGWLHSGDVGKKDADGFLYITGRIKELIITAGGENIPPVLIEDMVKEELPCVSNCMLIGDKRKFLSMLITLKTQVDADSGVPQDQLADLAVDWCTAQGSQASTVSAILDAQDPVVLKGIQEGIDRVNKRATSNAQKVQKWSLLPVDFSIPGEELGPTLKLKRPVVMKKYEATIEGFYAE